MRPIVWLALCLPAAPALAQQAPAPSTCNVQIDSSRHSDFHLVGSVYETFAHGGVWAHCREQPTTMYSDSVAWYPENDLLFLVGRVRFRDSVSVLNADRVTYYLRQERLFAQGNVYTKNLRTRSDLRGPNLDYYRVAPPIRDTLEILARNRPTIHFYSAPRGDRSDSVEPFVVVADRTRMRGSDQMWAGGTVTIDRSDVAARGDSGQLDLGRNVGTLLGHPQVNGTGRDAYHLNGERITFTLTPEHEIRHVLSSGQAAARGSDWHLEADTLDMTLDSGKVQLAEAWGTHQRPNAVSGAHTIVADSLDIHMPAQLVRLVWAYGHARTVTRDSASSDEDWITGDTLRADFAVKRDSAGARPKSDLEHMTSFGSARALYHVESADTAVRGRKGVNYSRGRRIDIATNDSKVRAVDVVGQVDGVYLEPLPPAADTGAQGRDSTRTLPADTTRAPAAGATRVPAADTTRAPAGRPPARPERP
jgi:lipopolysaccharide export system protein LptA